MDKDKNKNQPPISTNLPNQTASTTDMSTGQTQQPQTPASGDQTSAGGLSMGFSMNPPATPSQPTMPNSTTPEQTTSEPSILSQAGLQNDSQQIPPQDTSMAPMDPGYTQTKSHRMTYIFIFLAILIVISLVVLFFYRQYMNITGQNEVAPTTSPQVTKSTSPSVAPTLTPVNEEEADLQQINIEDIDNELKDIETDVNQLNASPTVAQ